MVAEALEARPFGFDRRPVPIFREEPTFLIKFLAFSKKRGAFHPAFRLRFFQINRKPHSHVILLPGRFT
jgi:hypothetical protein